MSTQEMVQAFLSKGGKVSVCPPMCAVKPPQLSNRRLQEVRKGYAAGRIS